MSLPVVELSTVAAVLVDCVVWAGVSLAVGLTAAYIPDARFARDGWLLRVRIWERSGRVYQDRLRIKAWKAHLPEAGQWFAGGFDKKHLRRGDPAYLEEFVVETRRAEWTHWTLVVASPLFVLWNPWWLALAMMAYAVIANGPCIIIQRYNRCRLQRVVDRARRTHRTIPTDPPDQATLPTGRPGRLRAGPRRAPDLPRQVGDSHK